MTIKVSCGIMALFCLITGCGNDGYEQKVQELTPPSIN